MNRSLAVCVTFYYRRSRLPYLKKTIHSLATIPCPVDIYIVSNFPFSANLVNELKSPLSNIRIHWEHLQVQGHPLLFPWFHFSVWQRLDLSQYTHFLYLEDDISFVAANFDYWCKWREILRSHHLIPGFLRCESDREASMLYATDICTTQFLPMLPKIFFDSGHSAVNLLYSYQGLYLFDQELLREFFSSQAFSPNFGVWKIQEKAAQGLTFCNVPKGFYSRIVFPVAARSALLLREALVEHSCATYVANRTSRLAKIPVDRIFAPFPSFRFLLRGLVTRTLDAYIFSNRN